MNGKRKTGRPNAALVVIVLIMLLLDAALIGVYEFRTHREEIASAGSSIQSMITELVPTLDKNQESVESAAEKERERAAAEAEPGIVVSGRPSIEAKAGEKTIRGIHLENDPENEGRYYITYELRLPDTSPQGYEILFTTNMIEPGNVIEDVELSRALEAGEYECTLHVQPYNMSTLTQTNNADLVTRLIVK